MTEIASLLAPGAVTAGGHMTTAKALFQHLGQVAEREYGLPAMEVVDRLTERERDVMDLVVAGLPNKLIADQLEISVRTVEVHRSRVFEKMDVKSAVELANLLRTADAAPAP